MRSGRVSAPSVRSMPASPRPPVVVLGAGAAGLMAAGWAATAGAEVVLVERTRQGGKKIVVSGGGRCNVLPSEVDVRRFVSASPQHVVRRMLGAWPLGDQRRFFEETLGVPLALEAETGKLFPASNRATDVRAALVDWTRRAGVRHVFDTRVTAVLPVERAADAAAEGARWRVETDGGGAIEAASVVVATGGLSVPNTGSDGFGLVLARRLGHTLVPTYAALTPLTSDAGPGGAPVATLAGVSLAARVAGGKGAGAMASARGFLFTHRGYSGPSVLDVAHLVTRARALGDSPPPLTVRWLPDLDDVAWNVRLQAATGPAAPALRRAMPARLADALLAHAGVAFDQPLAHLPRDARRRLATALGAFPLRVTGDEGYRTAEVTGGGVALADVDLRTLESRLAPGLHFCGEVLDAFGPIGGFNFLWAWATGRSAGLGAAEG